VNYGGVEPTSDVSKILYFPLGYKVCVKQNKLLLFPCNSHQIQPKFRYL